MPAEGIAFHGVRAAGGERAKHIPFQAISMVVQGIILWQLAHYLTARRVYGRLPTWLLWLAGCRCCYSLSLSAAETPYGVAR